MMFMAKNVWFIFVCRIFGDLRLPLIHYMLSICQSIHYESAFKFKKTQIKLKSSIKRSPSDLNRFCEWAFKMSLNNFLRTYEWQWNFLVQNANIRKRDGMLRWWFKIMIFIGTSQKLIATYRHCHAVCEWILCFFFFFFFIFSHCCWLLLYEMYQFYAWDKFNAIAICREGEEIRGRPHSLCVFFFSFFALSLSPSLYLYFP